MRIVRKTVKKHETPVPVYCINVPRSGNFMLDNGNIVSNCGILTFAQPKRESWGLPDIGELIESHHITHSSKKIMKCFSVSSLNFKKDSDEGILYLDLARRGESRVKIKIKKQLSRALFTEIP